LYPKNRINKTPKKIIQNRQKDSSEAEKHPTLQG